MANLNLSQFGEKLFVADADHTFIWDTAASISKRVSRNSWLNSGTLTADAPVTISQTWNNAAVAFNALIVNAAGPSLSNSLLLDLQFGGVSKFKVEKSTSFVFRNNTILFEAFGANTSGLQCVAQENFTFRRGESGTNRVLFNPLGVYVTNSSVFGFSSTGDATGTPDTILLRDGAANTLALRNGINPQTFNVYGTYTSASVYERMFMRYNGTDLAFQVGAETLGATLRPIDFVIGGTRRLMIGTTGNVGIGTNGAPVATLELRKDAAINGPMMVIRSNVRVAGNWASISFGDDTQASAYRKGALIYESTASSANGKFHIALNNDGTTADATLADARLTVLPSGNVGIGTTSPTSKLQVSAGDVEVDTIAKGVILKSPDGTRYRVTVANGGTLSVAAV